jgi:hypothetical protein
VSLGVAELDRWDPEAVRDVASAALARAEAAASAAADLAHLPALTRWEGAAADAARVAVTAIRVDLDAHAEGARALAGAAGTAAEAIARVKAELRRLDDDARDAGLSIDHASGAVLPGPDTAGAGARLGAGDVHDRLREILAEADTVDAELTVAMASTGLVTSESSVLQSIQGSEPTAVRAWWESLTAAQRAELVMTVPERLGNRDGIPVADRDIANRTMLAADLRRVELIADRNRVSISEIASQPEAFGLSAIDMIRYSNAIEVNAGLTRSAPNAAGAAAYLMVYRPEMFGGQGRAAIATGDPDRATHTAVVVPGTGSSVAAGWLRNRDSIRLSAEIRRATGFSGAGSTGSGPTGSGPAGISVVAWMGYDAPDSMADPRVARPGMARAGAALLAADVNALKVTGAKASHVTVIGHSYGSTAVADAAAGYGMAADDVVLIGSPGTDLARTAADFRLPDTGRVYVGAASTDPVTFLAGLTGDSPATIPADGLGLGADPAVDGFGATRFKAEVANPDLDLWQDHVRYFDLGSESLYSMAEVASGEGHSLEADGMTAPHRSSLLGSLASALRLPNWAIPLTDPELPRPATTGHRH